MTGFLRKSSFKIGQDILKITLGIKKPDVCVCIINHVHIGIMTPCWQVNFMKQLAFSENFQDMWHILPECIEASESISLCTVVNGDEVDGVLLLIQTQNRLITSVVSTKLFNNIYQ